MLGFWLMRPCHVRFFDWGTKQLSCNENPNLWLLLLFV